MLLLQGKLLALKRAPIWEELGIKVQVNPLMKRFELRGNKEMEEAML